MGKISQRLRQQRKPSRLPWVIALVACLVAAAAWAPRFHDPLEGQWVVVQHRDAKRIGKRVDVADGAVRIDGAGLWKYRWDGDRVLWGPLELPYDVRFSGDSVVLDGGESVTEWRRP